MKGEGVMQLDLTAAVDAAAAAHYEAQDAHAVGSYAVPFDELTATEPLLAHAYREHIFEAVVAAAPHIAIAVLRRAAEELPLHQEDARRVLEDLEDEIRHDLGDA